MPRVLDAIRKCSFYLYPSEQEARSGESRGGSGFVVAAIDHDLGSVGLLYAVTAGHVIGKASVIRFNRTSTTPFVVATQEDRGHRSSTHDLAILALHGMPTNTFDLFLMPAELAITRERAREEDIGVGDDVFTVGRFLGHDGRERNLPTVRFGAISMMPEQPIHNPTTGLDEESFLVELRSLTGFSGAPVFLYRDAEPFGSSTRLLGTLWGHIEHRIQKTAELGTENSGMAGVTPSWAMLDLLYDRSVLSERRALLAQG